MDTCLYDLDEREGSNPLNLQACQIYVADSERIKHNAPND